MRKMLFETMLSGHRMEYIHHIYMGMIEHPSDEYVIVVPKEFEEKKGLYDWPKVDNICFKFIEEENASANDDNGLLKESFSKTKLLRKYVLQEQPESVFLISLMAYIPFLPLLIPKSVNVSGILYKIYLYRWSKSSWKTKIGDVLKFLLISGRNCIKTVFVLNDAPSAQVFNKLYHTKKFRYITDPYNVLHYKPINLRDELAIPKNNNVFLHFGGLSRRKGTLVILEAIKLMNEEVRKTCTFIFAGRVYSPIHDEFYSHIKELTTNCNIIVFDEFVSNERLADLCVTCDFILAPYSNTIQSSGVLGHAANYERPVIGPANGLVGKLIRRNQLGIAMKDINSVELARVMSEVKPHKLQSSYKSTITVRSFIDTIFDSF